MNKEKQRIKIAELCGVEHGLVCHNHSVVPYDRALSHEFQGVKVKKCPWCRSDLRQICPDYLNDLNAMNSVEKFIMGELSVDYLSWLYKFSCPWHASASQRAKAFLYSLNAWEEES